MLAERVEPVEGGSARGSTFGRPATRAMIYREAGSMLRAGLPLSRVLDVLIGAPESASIRADLAAVRDRIREGSSPAAALAATGRLSPFETAALEAGQRAGALDDSLLRLAEFMEEQERVRDRLRSALVYPALVAGLALIAAIAMLGFLLPGFARIWTDANIDLPPLTRGVLAGGRLLLGVGLPSLAVCAAAGWFLRRRCRLGAVRRGRIERFVHRLPVVGPAWAAVVAMRFARTLALLLGGGAPLIEALPLAARATGSAWTESEMERETDTVRHGGALADALRRVPPLAGALPAWVEAGEAGGDLNRMLMAAAGRSQEVWEKRLTRAAALVEPALIVVLGAFVLLIALAILLPILALNRSLG